MAALLLLLLLLHAAAQLAPHESTSTGCAEHGRNCDGSSDWTVLNNTDFPSNCASHPYAHGSGAQNCAVQCTNRSDCVAVIFCAMCNAPGDSSAGACAFKCRSDNPVQKKGIEAIIVRSGKTTCAAPPPVPPAPPPPPPFKAPDAAKDPDWLERYQGANLLYADNDLDGALMPYVGNGYIATHPVAGTSPGGITAAAESMATMFVSGVFNGIAVQSPCNDGYCATPHRAKVPTYRVVLNGTATLSGRYALDIEKAMLLRRVTVAGLKVEERWYAHFVHRELLVHEVTLNNTAGTAPHSVLVDAVAGSQDPSFPYSVTHTGVLHTVLGAANHSEMPELNRTYVAVSSNRIVGSKLHVAAGQSKDFHFISAVATSLDSLDPQAKAEAKIQAALKDPSVLRDSHEAAWLQRWDQGRVEVGGDLGLAQAVNSSIYFMLSSVRQDWPLGMSPGGLASDGYDGHTLCAHICYHTVLLYLIVYVLS
jgi:hypothetical protein